MRLQAKSGSIKPNQTHESAHVSSIMDNRPTAELLAAPLGQADAETVGLLRSGYKILVLKNNAFPDNSAAYTRGPRGKTG